MNTISETIFYDVQRNNLNEIINKIQMTIDHNKNQIIILQNDINPFNNNQNLIDSLEFCNNILLFKIADLTKELLELQIKKEIYGTRKVPA